MSAGSRDVALVAAATLLVASVLAACGGEGGGEAANGASGSPTGTQTSTSGGSTSSGSTTTTKKKSGSVVVAFIRELGPLGGPSDPREGPYGALADGDCEDALQSADDLEEPRRTLYRGAAAACLAAFEERPSLWLAGERAVQASRQEPWDCLDRPVLQFLEALVRAHRSQPDAQFQPQATSGKALNRCPVIESLDPPQGPVTGGYPVRLRGRNLPDPLVVLFDDARAEVVARNGHREAVVLAPPVEFSGTVVNVWIEGMPFGPLGTPIFQYVEETGSPTSETGSPTAETGSPTAETDDTTTS
jgi:hypothetical protein